MDTGGLDFEREGALRTACEVLSYRHTVLYAYSEPPGRRTNFTGHFLNKFHWDLVHPSDAHRWNDLDQILFDVFFPFFWFHFFVNGLFDRTTWYPLTGARVDHGWDLKRKTQD